MKRRLTYALAALALLLSVAAGAVAAQIDGAADVDSNHDGYADSAGQPPSVAGFNSTKMGTEMSY